MAIVKNNSNLSSISPCCCYKVANLSESILNSHLISNFEDRYLLGERLGWGQFGIIRECTDKVTGERLACKSIAKDKLVTLDDLHSVKLEIEIMRKLSGHPNVVELKAVFEEEKYVHLVMELCAGGELFEQLEKHGRFCESEARKLFKHLMEVVLYCHEMGVVHRDLKPENILLATKSSTSPIKLADFGLATYIKPGQNLYGTVGSPFYIAPEVLGGGYNEAADVWSAGVILYILLSGVPPFWGKTKSRIFDVVRTSDLRFPSDSWDYVSSSAKDLVSRMLCRDPTQRLTAVQVLGHPWIKECVYSQDQTQEQNNSSCGQDLNWGHSPSSIDQISRVHDFSFGYGSPLSVQTQSMPQSPTFTCKSSFSSLLVDTPPCSRAGGFSFRSCNESTSLEFCSPIPSMPSFAFCSSSNVDDTKPVSAVDSIQRENSFGKLFSLLDSSSSIMENKIVDGHRVNPTMPRSMGLHNKRNRTIGLGELDQLDMIVNESVIRWASCNHLPTSLRSSLVC